MNSTSAPVSPASSRTEIPDTQADPLLIGFGFLLGLALCVLIVGVEPADPIRPPLVFGPMLVGLLLPRLRRHHYRTLGMTPWAMLAASVVAVVAAVNGCWCNWTVGFYAFFLGAAIGCLLRFRDSFRLKMRRFSLFALLGLAVTIGVVVVYRNPGNTDDMRFTFDRALLLATIAFTPIAWWFTARPWVEFTVEVLFRPMYRVSAVGPGPERLPITGSCVILANHAAWFDPLFLSKIFRRPTAPMMSERFYRIWFLKPILKYLTKVIVVPDVPFRHNAPEIGEAIQALDEGRCLVIFPEGYLRRKEEVPLRRFGQGIWQILAARPETPVFACWIEGGWGSYVSFRYGPPTKNKKFDIRRRIQIASPAPFLVPAEVLAEQMATRLYLMKQVSEARSLLGLPPLAEQSEPEA